MIPSHRAWFNREYTPAKYQRFLSLMTERCGGEPLFRHSETPVFLPASLGIAMAQAGREMVEKLLADPEYERASRAAIPERYRVPNEDPRPLFVQADFGLDRDLQPKLVEIQGFPTLYAYQPVMADCYRDAYGVPFPSLMVDDYHALVRQAIVGDCDPAEVALVEIDPWQQKTRHDFVLTERFYGVRTVDIREIRKEGRRLVHNGVPIRRIYNRAIVDELERKNAELHFDFRDDLDVQWAGHPNWFFRLSKFSLPYLDHPAVPKTYFLSEPLPDGRGSDNLNRLTASDTEPRPSHTEPRPSGRGYDHYVLKPLYSFAGRGVIVGPTAEEVAAAPPDQYILQERVDFQPVIETPFGPTKIEVRIMYLWLKELRPVNMIIRMGRGAQMGVDFNRSMEWVGGSAAFLDSSL